MGEWVSRWIKGRLTWRTMEDKAFPRLKNPAWACNRPPLMGYPMPYM